MTTQCPEPENVMRSLLPGEPEVAALRSHVAGCDNCRQIASGLEREIRRVRRELGGPVSETRRPDCLSDDMLAAFADGALSGDEHARAVRHLADCASCTAAVAALANALRDPAVRAERVRLERGRWMGGRAWGAVGAVAAAVLLFVVGRQVLAPRPAAWDIAALARQAAGASGVPAAWADVPWLATRGAGVGSLGARAAAFRVGMRVLDLRVAVESGDTVRVRRWAGELADLLAAIPLADPARAALAGVTGAIAGQPADSVREADRRFEAAVRYAGDSAQVNAGLWIEAARLAVLSGRVDVLGSSELRRAVQGLAGVATVQSDSLASALATPSADQLATIRRLLDAIALAAGG